MKCLHGADSATCPRCPRPIGEEPTPAAEPPRRAGPIHVPAVVAVVPTIRVVDQPPPAPERAELPAVWELVISDVERGTPPPLHLKPDRHALYGALLGITEALAALAGVTDLPAEMRERDRLGRERYGTPLQPFNGRDPLQDGLPEALDLLVYFRQYLYETEGR